MKSFGYIVVTLVLAALGLALYTAHIAFVAHALGRQTSTEVVAVASLCTVFFVILAVYPAWIAYLIFFRCLNDIEVTSGGYVLKTGAEKAIFSMELKAVRKVGSTAGPSELMVVRADGSYWVCLSSKLTGLTAPLNGSFVAMNSET